MENIEMQELHCHNCGNYVQFPLDKSLNGRHILNCPECNHEHCRVVHDGIISDERWASRNGIHFLTPPYQVLNVTSSTNSAYDPYSISSIGASSTGGAAFLCGAWINATS